MLPFDLKHIYISDPCDVVKCEILEKMSSGLGEGIPIDATRFYKFLTAWEYSWTDRGRNGHTGIIRHNQCIDTE